MLKTRRPTKDQWTLHVIHTLSRLCESAVSMLRPHERGQGSSLPAHASTSPGVDGSSSAHN